MVEGQTEYAYFLQMKTVERFHDKAITVRQAPHSNPQSVLDFTIHEIQDNCGIYDKVFCVFDWDVVVQKNLVDKVKPKIRQLRKNGGLKITSLPSFEVWFLAHYGVPNVHYENQKEVVNELNNFIPGYSKGNEWLSHSRIYSTLKPMQSIALENVKILESKTHDYDNPTFTEVDRVVLSLLD